MLQTYRLQLHVAVRHLAVVTRTSTKSIQCSQAEIFPMKLFSFKSTGM